jgi:hypothetical protein
MKNLLLTSALTLTLLNASCSSTRRSAERPFTDLSAVQKKELTEAYVKFFWDMKFARPPKQKHLQLEPGSYSK